MCGIGTTNRFLFVSVKHDAVHFSIRPELYNLRREPRVVSRTPATLLSVLVRQHLRHLVAKLFLDPFKY